MKYRFKAKSLALALDFEGREILTGWFGLPIQPQSLVGSIPIAATPQRNEETKMKLKTKSSTGSLGSLGSAIVEAHQGNADQWRAKLDDFAKFGGNLNTVRIWKFNESAELSIVRKLNRSLKGE